MHENAKTSHTIFLIEEDNHARPILTKNLRDLGYRVLVSTNLDDAVEWMDSSEYIHADLLLINLIDKVPEEVLSIGRRLRERCKYDGNTPIVVMPEKVPVNVEGTNERVNDLDWICYYEDADQLQRLLARLLDKRS